MAAVASNTSPTPEPDVDSSASVAECDVFISHAGEDKRGIVSHLNKQLKELGFTTFVDVDSLEMGLYARETLPPAVKKAGVVVYMITPDFVGKEYPMEEVRWRLEEGDSLRKKIIPVFCGEFNRTHFKGGYQPVAERLEAGAKRRKVVRDTLETRGKEAAEQKAAEVKRQWVQDLVTLASMGNIDQNDPHSGLCNDALLVERVVKEVCRKLGRDSGSGSKGQVLSRFPKGLSKALIDFWAYAVGEKSQVSWEYFSNILKENSRCSTAVRQCQDWYLQHTEQEGVVTDSSAHFVDVLLKPILSEEGTGLVKPANLLLWQEKVANMAHQKFGRNTSQQFKNIEDLMDLFIKSFNHVRPYLDSLAAQLQVQGVHEAYGVSSLLHEFLPGSRSWLLEEVDQWLTKPANVGRNRLFVLMAGPGMGKSVFSAQLTRVSQSHLAAHHFFKVDDPKCARVKSMMLSVLLQLAERMPAVRRKLGQVLAQKSPEEWKGTEWEKLFDEMMHPVLKNVDAGLVPSTGVVVLLDALDEAEVEADGKPLVLKLINKCLKHLPVWMRLLVTTRPDLAKQLKGWEPTIVHPTSPDNLGDLEQVIHHKLDANRSFLSPGTDLQAAAQVVLDKSKGVFLYTKLVFEELKTHPSKGQQSWTIQDLEQFLPSGINSVYERILDRAQQALANNPKLQHLVGPLKAVVLPVLATMMSPLSVEELRWVTGIETEKVDDVPLSRPKRNIARDFSDGVLLAEVVGHYYPRLVQLHNYSPANGLQQKLYNLHTLNQRVFKRLGFTLSKEECEDVASCKPGAIERVLKLLQTTLAAQEGQYLDQYLSGVADRQDSYEKISSTSQPSHPQQKAGMAQTYPGKTLPTGLTHMEAAIAPRPAPGSLQAPPGATAKAASMTSEALAQQNKVITELRETNEILESKVRKLEQLVRLKDAKIQTLQAKLQAAGLN